MKLFICLVHQRPIIHSSSSSELLSLVADIAFARRSLLVMRLSFGSSSFFLGWRLFSFEVRNVHREKRTLCSFGG